MSAPARPVPQTGGPARGAPLGLWALFLGAALAVAVYAPTIRSPFQFDDITFVRSNQALHSLWPPLRWIRSEKQETRPLVNFTFALNYAVGQMDPSGYHVLNLLLHLGCLGLLFVFVRRALSGLDPPWPERADIVAGAATLLLAVHSVQAETVIYIQGRPGLMAAFFGLAALARTAGALRRGPDGAPPRAGLREGLGVAGLTALGLMCKESAAVVPALVLLYDGAVVARGRWSQVRARLVRFHLPVWLSLGVLGALYASLRNPHSGVFGFGVSEAAPFYLTQPGVLLFYLKLSLWPTGLTVDHAMPLASVGDPAAWLRAAAVLILAAITLWALRRAPWPGFCAAWWFAAVLPTSLVPNREFVAERYLSFATPAFAALVAWSVAAAWSRWGPRAESARAPALASLAVCGLLTLPLAAHTTREGRLWMSGRTLWERATSLEPARSRTWYQYAWFLWLDADYGKAFPVVRRAIALAPREALPMLLLSRLHLDTGQVDSAMAEARAAQRLWPRDSGANVHVALAHMARQEWREAIAACEDGPNQGDPRLLAFYYRAQCRAELGDTAQARADARELEVFRPGGAFGPYVHGLVDYKAGRYEQAARWLDRAIERDRRDIEARRLRAFTRTRLGRSREALQDFRVYLTLMGGAAWDYPAYYCVGTCQLALGQDAVAARNLRRVTQGNPELAEAWIELAYTLAASRDPTVRDSVAAQAALEQGMRRAELGNPAVRTRIQQVRAALGGA